MIQIDPDEKVIYEIRHHWFVLLKDSMLLIFLAFVPWVLYSVLDAFNYSFSGASGTLFVFVTAGWFLFIWVWFLIVWTNYYLDVWAVTDKRIIDIEQYSLFSRDVSEFRLDRLQDVTIEIKGFLPTILKFGDIHVQTAGERRRFIIRRIPHPYEVKDIIIKAHSKAISKSRDIRGGH